MSDTSPAMRRSALMLHAMSASDRGWILARLPVARRAPLHRLLDELKQLGFSADRTMLDQLVSAAGPDAGLAAESDTDEANQRPGQLTALRNAAPALLAAALRDEPAQLTAAILQMHAWPWHEQLLKQLEPLKRRQVVERLEAMRAAYNTAACGEQMRSLLLNSLQRRVDAAAQRAGAAAHVARQPSSVAQGRAGRRGPSWLARLTGKRQAWDAR